MALKSRKTARISLRLNLNLLLLLLTSLCLNTHSVFAVGNGVSLPSFADFSQIVQNGQKEMLRGVYVDNVLALPVVQQPSGNTIYVSNNDGEVTQFGVASQYGNVGLLAHNHKAGKSFSELAPGQDVLLVYGDGHIETFEIEEVLKFQALQPNNPFSSFKSLDKDEILTTGQMFNRVYAGDHHLTFQTCIAAYGKLSWGRLFIIARPKERAHTNYQQKY
jgi:hypothetical protein